MAGAGPHAPSAQHRISRRRDTVACMAVICVTLLATVNAAYGNDESLTTYENDEISITHPDSWEWHVPPAAHPYPHPAHRYVAMFATEYRGASVTISAYVGGEYPLVQHKQESIIIDEIDAASLATIEEDVKSRCRANIGMQCWNYEPREVLIASAPDGSPSGIISYDATINDRDVRVGMAVVSDGQTLWIAKGVSQSADTTGEMDAIIKSFHPRVQQDSGSQAGNITGVAEPDSARASDAPGIRITLERDIQVNIIMIGADAWTEQEKSRVSAALPKHYDPVYAITGEKVGTRYNYDYEFVSKTSHVKGILDAMDRHSDESELYGTGIVDAPIWQELWAHEKGLEDIPYRQVDAVAVESYINDVVIAADPDLGGFANIVFVDIPHDESGYLQNYYTSNRDAASGKRIDHVGLMGYGGSKNADANDRNRLFFYDLWAVPWVDYDHESGKYLIYPEMRNMYDCQDAGDDVKNDTYHACRAAIAGQHASSATYHIATPSLLYPIYNHERYKLDILLYLKPGSSVTVTPATVDNFLNEDVILEEMRYLYPDSEWEIDVSIERRDLRGLSYEFKRQFEQSKHITTKDIFGNDRQYDLLSTSNITPYLAEWGQARQAAHSTQDVWNIPILVVIDSTDTIVLFDNGLLGIAAGMPGDKTIPCCAIGVADERDVWDREMGLTNIILHETGHILGLAHPFVGFNKTGDAVSNSYYNWYSSPMTYSLPIHPEGCGFLYSVTHDSPCGNGAMSFTEFERDAVTGARIAHMLNDALKNIRGIEPARAIPVSLLVYESTAKFRIGSIYGTDGALALAQMAYEAGTSAAGIVPDNATESISDTGDKIQGAQNDATDDTQANVQGMTQDHIIIAHTQNDTASKAVFVGEPRHTAHNNADGTPALGDGAAITGRISNMLMQGYDTTLLIRITDGAGFVTYLNTASYTLDAGYTATYSFEWMPEKGGTYKVAVFALDMATGTIPLASPTYATITVR